MTETLPYAAGMVDRTPPAHLSSPSSFPHVTSTARPTTTQLTASGAATSRRDCLAEATDVRRPTWRTRIRPGDVIYIEQNEERWHGATAGRFMAHVAIQEADEQGDVVTWLDHVTDEEYSLR